MKKTILIAIVSLLFGLNTFAQYYDITPAAKVINAVGRVYYVNRDIAGQTSDGTGINYILLHKAYAGVVLADHYVMGKITAVRGSTGSYNRKWTVEVNTASAYTETRGTLIAYNDPSRLVTLTYNGERYIAAEIGQGSSMYGISFTGYALNEALILATTQQASNVQAYTSTFGDYIKLQGRTIIADDNPLGTLNVVGPEADLNANNSRITSSGLIIQATNTVRNLTKGAQLEFALPADNGGGNPFGHARIITLPADVNNGSANGKMVLGTRRFFNKRGTGNEWFYGDDIVIDASGNVGIGTLSPQAKLAVKGEVHAQKVKVTLTGWSDFVFEPTYKFPSIYETEQYILKYKHLPGIPSEAEVKEKGVDVGEMNKLLLQKLEEQMLYIIELKKEVDALKKSK